MVWTLHVAPAQLMYVVTQLSFTNMHSTTCCTAHCCCAYHAVPQQVVWLMQAAISQLVGSCLVLATRHGLDLPQPVLDLPALADFVNVPIGQCSQDLWLLPTALVLYN